MGTLITQSTSDAASDSCLLAQYSTWITSPWCEVAPFSPLQHEFSISQGFYGIHSYLTRRNCAYIGNAS